MPHRIAIPITAHPASARQAVLNDIDDERNRQIDLKNAGRFEHTPDECSALRAYGMLGEEMGEVARCTMSLLGEVQEKLDRADLYTELIHLAAVAAAAAEGLANGTLRTDAA